MRLASAFVGSAAKQAPAEATGNDGARAAGSVADAGASDAASAGDAVPVQSPTVDPKSAAAPKAAKEAPAEAADYGLSELELA